MNWKKALAIGLGIFALILVVCFIVEAFLPNIVTGSVVFFLIVTLPAFFTSLVGQVTGIISGFMAVTGGYLTSLRNTKNTAKTQIADAQTKATEANQNVTSLLSENQKFTQEIIPAKDAEIKSLTTKLEATTAQTQQIQDLTQQNRVLQAQLGEYRNIRDTQGIPPNPNDVRVITSEQEKTQIG